MDNIDANVRGYYKNEYLERLNKNLDKPKSVADYWPDDKNTRILQNLYIASNSNETGSKHMLDFSDDSSSYTITHKKFHPIIRNYLEKFGFYDVFLVDPETGHIVYTVFKEADYGTSLLTGAYKETNLADAFRAAKEAAMKEFVKLEDFKPYHPSYNAFASFIASPIYDGNEKIGVVVFQMPVDRINNIMTNKLNWDKAGLGKSGETYLVAGDYTLRSQSRLMVEDKENYLKILKEIGTPRETVDKINRFNISIGLQTSKTQGTESGLKGETGAGIFPNYRGIPVISSYKPLNIEDMNWIIMGEIDNAEVLNDIYLLRNRILWISGILMAVISGISYAFSKVITRPLVRLRNAMIEIENSGDFSKRIDIHSKDEIGKTVHAVNEHMELLRSAIASITATIKAVAEGDFTRFITLDLKGDLGILKNSINASCVSINDAMTSILINADILGRSAFNERNESSAELNGELKIINETLDNSVKGIAIVIEDINRVMKCVEARDLTQRVNVEANGRLEKLKERINSSLNVLASTLKNTMDKTHQVAAASGQSSTAISQISDGAQNQVHSIGEIVTAIKDTNASTDEVCQNIANASKNVQKITENVYTCKSKMDNLVKMVKMIAQSSDEIGKITDVIETIANKTNMLSLNAAIEAASAGEHGKGFAVVADEVRKLAEQSATSAQNIAGLIEQAVGEAGRAVNFVTEVNTDMEEITKAISDSDKMLEQISSIMEEQSAAMQEVSANVKVLNEIGHTNAAATEEITATVMDLSRLAKETKDEIEQFKLNG